MDNPLATIGALAAAAAASTPRPAEFGERAHFEALLSSPECAPVPSLNSAAGRAAAATGGLVRVRCMVQDILDPEHYAMWSAAGGGEECGKYREHGSGGEMLALGERTLAFGVAVPGEAAWVGAGLGEAAAAAGGAAASGGKKRRLDTMEQDGDEVVLQNSGSKKAHTGDAAAAPAADGPRTVTPSETVLLKLYDQAAEELRVNDVAEFIGVYTVTPEAGAAATRGIFFAAEEAARNPPASLVPRVHVLTYRKLPHAYPLHMSALTPEMIASARSSVLKLASAAFGNDAISAHHALLQLVSRAYMHDEAMEMSLGALSVNYMLGPPESAAMWEGAAGWLAATLLPRAVTLPLTRAALNGASLEPHKNYERNRLEQTPLQVVTGTQLVVLETRLDAGKLEAVGVRNVERLARIAATQAVGYDFTYFVKAFPTSMPLAVVSNGASLLQADSLVAVPVRPAVGASPADAERLAATLPLDDLRLYLATVRELDFVIRAEMESAVQDLFVAIRRTNPHFGEAQLGLLLTKARLYGVSLGETELTPGSWAAAVQLEMDLMARQKK